ncbi:MAG: helix-turn-helix transcriptional regulator [Pseudomonadota bacterium]
MSKGRKGPSSEPPREDKNGASSDHSLDELTELVAASGVMGVDRAEDPEQRDRVHQILSHFGNEMREDLVYRIASEESLNFIKIRRFCERHELTSAEQKVVESLCAGLSLAQHAEAHFISPNTARTHLQRVREKVGVSRQADIVSKALR